mgnify:CR=1 FL=1
MRNHTIISNLNNIKSFFEKVYLYDSFRNLRYNNNDILFFIFNNINLFQLLDSEPNNV